MRPAMNLPPQGKVLQDLTTLLGQPVLQQQLSQGASIWSEQHEDLGSHMPAPTSTRTAWKGAISFGLVHIPIALHSATQDIRPKMHMIDKQTNAPVGHKNYDKSTGKEVAQDDIVKGLETEKGHFVALTKQEIAEALPKTTGTIAIEQFVKREDIPLSYFEKPYYIAPEGRGGSKPYALLREVLKRTNRAGLGKIVLSNRQHMAIVSPQDDVLVLLLLRWEAEVRDTAGLPLPRADEVSDRELKMAESLVMELDGPWTPENYRDEYVEKLEQVVEGKKKAGEVHTLTGVIADEIVPGQSPDIADLTELLRRSLRQRGSDVPVEHAANEPRIRAAAERKAGSRASTTAKPGRHKRT